MQAPATGEAPYGFRWNERRLVTNGEEAVIRRTIFELFAEHQRKGTVARILNERGFRTRRGGKWSDVAGEPEVLPAREGEMTQQMVSTRCHICCHFSVSAGEEIA